MFGVILSGFVSLFDEISDTIGKRKVLAHEVGPYTFGFITSFFAALLLLATGIWRNSFIFSTASYPTFLPRLVLEVFLAHYSIAVVVKADRSSYRFVRMLTIPFLLCVDVVLGYHLSSGQLLGVGCIVFAVFLLVTLERFHMKGFWTLLMVSLTAVVTLSLYKWDISHYNSVEAEQTIVQLVTTIYFFVLALLSSKENPIRFLKRPVFVLQAGASGASSLLSSFAYLLAPASVIAAAMRAFAVLFAIISGKYVFKEKRFGAKLTLFLLIVVGLVLLAQG